MERAIEISGLQAPHIDKGMISAALVMVGTIASFITYENLNLTPAVVALAGGFFMMMIQCKNLQAS